MPYNQQGNLNNANIPQNYEQNNHLQNQNRDEDIEMRDEIGKNSKENYISQPGTKNIQQGAYPPQIGANPEQGKYHPQQGTYQFQQGSYPPQQGANISQPGAQQPGQQNPPKQNYIFSKKGLKNIGSTCYMNATLQCLLHVSELTIYFIEEYPKDQQLLSKKNNNVPSGGNISNAFFNLVIGVNENSEYVKSKINM
jgi:hypothetical protein